MLSARANKPVHGPENAERRSFERINDAVGLTVEKLEKDVQAAVMQRVEEGLTNASADTDVQAMESPNTVVSMGLGGLAFEWDKPCFEDDVILVNLTLFPSKGSIQAVGKVVRSRPADRVDNGRFHCAVKFIAITDADKAKVMEQIKALTETTRRSVRDLADAD